MVPLRLFQPCITIAITAVTLVGCGATARLPVSAGLGPHPDLPPPSRSLFPTVNVVSAKGWPTGAHPTPAEGTKVAAFARGLDHPRWLYVLPNGDVLVAETNAPERPDDRKGVKGAIMEHEMKRTGGATPSANRITLLRDADGDGIAEKRSVLLAGLNSPFGMALIGHYLYIANTDAVLRFPYADGDTVITAVGTVVTKLP